MQRIVLIIIFTGLIFGVPSTMFFQGKLKDDVGGPVTGIHAIRFEIVDEIGTVLWFETQSIEFREGLFVAELGLATPLPLHLWDDEGLYTRVFVDGDEIPELTPLITVPYAFRAANADTSAWANGVYWDSIQGIPDDVPGLVYGRATFGPEITDSLIFDAGDNIEIETSGNTLRFSATGADTDWVWEGEDIHNGNSGNVGIGTETPANLFHVAGEGRFDGSLTVGEYTFTDVDGDSGQVLYTDGAGNVEWSDPLGDGWGRDTAFTEAPIVGNGADIPIGLNHGRGLLLHSGVLEVDAGEGLGFIGNTIINTGDLDPDDDRTTETVYSGDVHGTYDSLAITTGAIVPSDLSAASPEDFDFLSYDDSLDVFQWISIDDISDRDWEISGDNMSAIPVGNVGIGTETPAHKLDVEGDGRFNGPLTIGEYTLPYTIGTDGQILKNIGGTIVWSNDERSTGGGDGNDMVRSDSEDPVEGYLSGKVDNSTIEVNLESHRIRVKENGIGSIHIQDTTIREIDLHPGDFEMWDKDTSDDLSRTTIFGGDVEGTYDDLQIVEGAVTHRELRVINTPEDGLVLGFNGDSLEWSTGSGADDDWSGAGSGSMFTTNPDNIGIGTATPESRLHVVGDVLFDGSLRITDLSAYHSAESILVIGSDGYVGFMDIDLIASGGGMWQKVETEAGDSAIVPVKYWGIARQRNILHGINAHTHINLATNGVTGSSGENPAFITISGGADNTAAGESSTISGGTDNSASGDASFIGGGMMNVTEGQVSVVTGGGGNLASGNGAAIGGGAFNIASSTNATVSGGHYNQAEGDFSTIGGGSFNSVDNYSSTVAGGGINIARANYSTIGGGYSNTASGIAAVISGGSNNTAASEYSSVVGGYQNNAAGKRSIVAGGSYLKVGDRSFGFRGGAGGNPTSLIDVSGETGTFHIVDTRFHFNYDNDDTDFRIDGLSDNAFFMRAEDNRIGIGTDDPTARLDIDGTVAIGDTLDMEQNQIKNMVIENRSDNPDSPVVGQMWMRVDY